VASFDFDAAASSGPAKPNFPVLDDLIAAGDYTGATTLLEFKRRMDDA
jgi:hypothetical protein